MAEIDEKRLKYILGNYHHIDVTYNDIIAASKQYRGLKYYRDTYTFNDGTPMTLINLAGTIPVRYKGNSYNIPITIWLMDTHPKNAPICYVKPTPDMSIKVSQFVDQSGKVYLPYLHDWVSGVSDLLGLIQVMVVTFGEQPPVFANPFHLQQPNVQRNNYPPPYPPGGAAYPPVPTTSTYGGYNIYNPAGGGGNPPGGVPNPGGGGGNPGYGVPQQQPQPPYPTNTYSPSPPYPSFTGAGGYGGVMPIPPGVAPASVTPPSSGGGGGMASLQPTPHTVNSGGTGTIREEHIRDSLISAIEDKLMRRMKEQLQQNQAELETLKRTQVELKQGKNKLDGILARLDKEKSDLDKYNTVLKDKEEELDKAIERLNNQESIDVDDAVITTAPLYKQLLNAFAEEAAIEDAIYNMGEALYEKVVDVDTFLKQVRTLSRKQFMLRALMQKCRQKAGLAAV